MSDEMIDVVTFVDDDDQEFDMAIVEEFEHKGKNYAVLAQIMDEHEHGSDCDCGHEHGDDEEENLYIFEVIRNEGQEDFVSIEDDSLMDELVAVVEELLFEDDEDEDK